MATRKVWIVELREPNDEHTLWVVMSTKEKAIAYAREQNEDVRKDLKHFWWWIQSMDVDKDMLEYDSETVIVTKEGELTDIIPWEG